MLKMLVAAFIGTAWLVLGGCGSTVLAAAYPHLGIGFAGAALACEIAMTFAFLFVIMGVTHGAAPKGFAPLAIGLCLTLIHLISIPVTNTSVNPARSVGPAVFVGGWALQQLWLFWVAPLIGGALGGLAYRWLSPDHPAQIDVAGS